MPARDIYHNAVKAALIADGWTITHDPYRIEYGGKDAYVDLGAERASLDVVLAAERGRILPRGGRSRPHRVVGADRSAGD
ncbi:MAG: element excision factor XisH family protein [Kouleothrix sp.]